MPQPAILPYQITGGGTPAVAGITSGVATLTAGDAVVFTSAVQAGSVIQLSYKTIIGTVGGGLVYLGINPGSNFTIRSSGGAADFSEVAWTLS